MSAILDTAAAADYLKLAPVTLRQWRSQGRGPPYVRMGRTIRYREKDLDAWMNRHTEEARYDTAPPRKRGVRKR